MNDARNHHFVPQSYLRNFAVGDKRKAKVFAIDFETGKTFRSLVRNVGALRDFNRIGTDEHHPNFLEETYGHLESAAAGAWRRIEAAKAFPEGEDRMIVATLMAVLAVRHPSKRAIMDDAYQQILRLAAEATLSSPERWEKTLRKVEEDPTFTPSSEAPTYEQMREFVLSDEYKFDVDRNALIGLEVGGFEPVMATLLERKWTLHVAEPGAGDFVTTDDPVCLLATKPMPPGMGVGHGMPNTMIIFPFTRIMSLVGMFDGPEATLPADAAAVALLNGLVIPRAHRMVFAPDDSFRYSRSGTLYEGRSLLRDDPFHRRRKPG